MWSDLMNWWQAIWVDPKVYGPAVAGFISALIILILGEVFWKTRLERTRMRTERLERQLNLLYSPLYLIYQEAYIQFDQWQAENQNTPLMRQPFLNPDEASSRIEAVMSQYSGYASTNLTKTWSEMHSSSLGSPNYFDAQERFVARLITDYQQLRKQLGLDYDKEELRLGAFGINQQHRQKP